MRRIIVAVAAITLTAAIASSISGCSLMGGGTRQTGDTIEGTNLSVTVKGVRFAREVSGFYPRLKQPAEGSLWAFVDLDIVNTSGSAKTDPFEAFIVSLITGDGKIATPGPAIMANGPPDFHNLSTVQALAAGESVSGSVPFYVSDGATLGTVKLRSADLGAADVIVDLGGIKATAPEEGIVAAGTAKDVGGVEVTVHGTRRKSSYSYRSGILTSSIKPAKGSVFIEVDLTLRNISIESSLTINEFFGNEIVKGAPDSPTAGRVFLMNADDDYASPMGSIGLFRKEMMPKPLWWTQKSLKVGDTKRAWVVFQVPEKDELELQTRMPRLGPPVKFALK